MRDSGAVTEEEFEAERQLVVEAAQRSTEDANSASVVPQASLELPGRGGFPPGKAVSTSANQANSARTPAWNNFRFVLPAALAVVMVILLVIVNISGRTEDNDIVAVALAEAGIEDTSDIRSDLSYVGDVVEVAMANPGMASTLSSCNVTPTTALQLAIDVVASQGRNVNPQVVKLVALIDAGPIWQEFVQRCG